jgi:hypothetical protein
MYLIKRREMKQRNIKVKQVFGVKLINIFFCLLMTPCILVDGNQHFGETYHLRLLRIQDGGGMLFPKVSSQLPDYTVL